MIKCDDISFGKKKLMEVCCGRGEVLGDYIVVFFNRFWRGIVCVGGRGVGGLAVWGIDGIWRS